MKISHVMDMRIIIIHSQFNGFYMSAVSSVLQVGPSASIGFSVIMKLFGQHLLEQQLYCVLIDI